LTGQNIENTNFEKFPQNIASYMNKRLHLARKYARIFVRVHYLFRGYSDIPQLLLGNIRPHDAFRPIARERKYLMDYNQTYVVKDRKSFNF